MEACAIIGGAVLALSALYLVYVASMVVGSLL